MPKPRLIPSRLSLRQTLASENMTLEEIAEQEFAYGSVPACCRHHCQVEPDGHCQHGNPSVYLAAGLI